MTIAKGGVSGGAPDLRLKRFGAVCAPPGILVDVVNLTISSLGILISWRYYAGYDVNGDEDCWNIHLLCAL